MVLRCFDWVLALTVFLNVLGPPPPPPPPLVWPHDDDEDVVASGKCRGMLEDDNVLCWIGLARLCWALPFPFPSFPVVERRLTQNSPPHPHLSTSLYSISFSRLPALVSIN